MHAATDKFEIRITEQHIRNIQIARAGIGKGEDYIAGLIEAGATKSQFGRFQLHHWHGMNLCKRDIKRNGEKNVKNGARGRTQNRFLHGRYPKINPIVNSAPRSQPRDENEVYPKIKTYPRHLANA